MRRPVTGKFPTGGADPHVAVEAIGLAVLVRGASPVLQDVVLRVLKIRFPFPGGTSKTFPVGLVENREDTTTAAYGLVAGDLVDLETLHCGGDVVLGDVVRRRFRGVAVEDVLGKPSRKKTGEIVSVPALRQGLQRATETRGLESTPGMSEGKSK